MRKVMKAALALMLFAASAFAQNPADVAKAACGPKGVSFDVNLDRSKHALTQPDPGKARIYFIHQAGNHATFGVNPTTRIGIDGAWVGAYRSNAYFSVSVGPGEHHLCADLQSLATGHQLELAHFTARAGKMYYYRTRLFLTQGVDYLELNPVDSDQAKLLIATFPQSVSHPRK